MPPLSGRRLTTAVTMTALVVVLCLMAVFGYRAATQPLPGSATTTAARCSKNEISKQYYVRPGDVTVSVYNAGARSGAAGRLMQSLMDRGFQPGDTANAPHGVHVRRAQVHTTTPHDTAARLVARTLGKGVTVTVSKKPLGPGIDVYVGPRFRHLARHAPTRLKLAKPIVSCVPVH